MEYLVMAFMSSLFYLSSAISRARHQISRAHISSHIQELKDHELNVRQLYIFLGRVFV